MTFRDPAPTLPDGDAEEGTLEPGAVLGGRYRLVRPLTSGGMGAIWLAHHLDLEAQVVIKAIEGRYRREPELLERFRREARAAAQLKTQHVVQIFDFGVDAGVPYIVMEHLQGEDLEALLEREGSIPLTRARLVVRAIARGLAAVHDAGIVHRDLKPGNVFLAQVGGEEIVKIIDFGIAKELYRAADHATGGRTMGSPLFMSPEQIASSANVDARTDVWALAAIAYQMVVGQTPFTGRTLAELLHAVGHAPVEPPSTRCPALHPLDAFFARGLARDRRLRFQTAAELADAFDEVVSQLSEGAIASGAPSAPPRGPDIGIAAATRDGRHLATTPDLQRRKTTRSPREGGSLQPFAATSPSVGEERSTQPTWLRPRWHSMLPVALLVVVVLVIVATVRWTTDGRSAPAAPRSASPGLVGGPDLAPNRPQLLEESIPEVGPAHAATAAGSLSSWHSRPAPSSAPPVASSGAPTAPAAAPPSVGGTAVH